MSDQNTTPKSGPANGAAKNAAQSKKTSESADSNTPAPKAEAADLATELANEIDEISQSDTADIGADATAVLAAEIETLQSQIADLTNRLLRAHADLDNLRKRAEREKQETARYAISNFAKDTVGLVDNFQRAMQAVEPEAIEKDPHLKALLDGVAMTEREFMNVLDRHGVKRVMPKGQPFDPRLHQAVMERQEASVANGTVVEVFQAGYTIEDRCLRPAMVVVARGGAKAVPPSPDQPDKAPRAETAAQVGEAGAAGSDDQASSEPTVSSSANDNPSG